MTVQPFTFNPFQTTCYVCHDGAEAALVDASSHTAAEHRQILGYLDAHGLTLRHLLLTHAHIDHVFGCAFFADHTGLGWQMHRDDLPLLRYAPEQATFFGASMEAPPPAPTAFLEAGDEVPLGAATLAVRFAPGHSPGSVCFYDAAHGFVLAGDVLFRGSIGRYDLPGGSLPTLMRSIETQLLTLDDATTVYPGHGPATTVGHERRTNPFLV